MKRLLLLFFLTGICLSGFTQRVYFLYIQSESEQPFYVKMNEKIYSSASKGYLILSHLRDSSYNFSIGFPGKNSGEQKFAVSMNGKDHGYLLKNNDQKGLGLFDLQTMVTIMPTSNVQQAEEKKGAVKKDESAFTQILAKASDDTTLLEKPELPKVKEEKKTELAKQEVKSPVVINDPPKQPEQKPEEKKTEIVEEKKTEPFVTKPAEIKKEEPAIIQLKEEPATKNESEGKQVEPIVYKKSEVLRKSESSTTEGFGVTFIDQFSDGQKDTIRILIPQVKEETQALKPEAKEEKKFLDISSDTAKQIPSTIIKEEKPVETKQTEVKPSVTTISTRKNNCSSTASESDFLKLRKKMVGEPDDAGMITEATKVFKGKCFTTEQIKNLGTLFLRDEGKYKFFDGAYSYVSDIENFSSLQSELKDEYYINRFKAMLH